MPRDHRTYLSNPAERAINREWRAAQELPAPGEQWLAREAGVPAGALKLFHSVGIIKKHEREEGPGDCFYWETCEGVPEFVETYIDPMPKTPCGRATGIRTIEPGTYTCTDPECDCRMDRETAAEVVA